MNGMRKWFCLLLGVAFAAFALPGIAQNVKTFTIATSPPSLSVGSTVMTATFANTANSNFNSFELDAITSANLTFDTTYTPTITTAGISGQLGPFNSTQIQFLNTSPIKPNKPVTIQFRVIATNGGCASANANWSGGAWAGSPSNPSATFTLSPSPASTPINPNCTLTFSQQPASPVLSGGLLGSAANPVTVTGSPAAAFSGKQVTVSLTGTPATATLSGNPSPVYFDPNGNAQFPGLTLTGTSPPSYTLSAITNGGAGYPTATSNSITILASNFPLGCIPGPGGNNSFNGGGNGVGTPGYMSGIRGIFNKDGSPCVLVPYALTPPSQGNNTTDFKWDTLSQPNAVITYSINWEPVSVDSDGWTAIQPLVAWESDKYSVVGKDYVPALACLSPNLPAPYGSLVADNGATITIDTTGAGDIPLPAGSFALVIGTERMQATVASGSGAAVILNVTRGTGGTVQITHSFGNPVMSTPLPIDPNLVGTLITDPASPLNGMADPYAQKQYHMCVVSHSWTVASDGTILYVTVVIDIGDGGVRLP